MNGKLALICKTKCGGIYTTGRRQRKPWLRIYHWMLDMALFNATNITTVGACPSPKPPRN
jgi:hypothetical protein